MVRTQLLLVDNWNENKTYKLLDYGDTQKNYDQF